MTRHLLRAATFGLSALALDIVAAPGPAKPVIVRADARSHRVFVVRQAFGSSSSATRSYIHRLSSVVTSTYPAWGTDWNASFFTSAHLAGYKDEPEILPYVKSGAWSEGYVAEYANATTFLVLYPLDPKRMVKSKVALEK